MGSLFETELRVREAFGGELRAAARLPPARGPNALADPKPRLADNELDDDQAVLTHTWLRRSRLGLDFRLEVDDRSNHFLQAYSFLGLPGVQRVVGPWEHCDQAEAHEPMRSIAHWNATALTYRNGDGQSAAWPTVMHFNGHRGAVEELRKAALEMLRDHRRRAQVAAHRVLLIDSEGAGTWARTTVGGLSNMTNTIAELCPANGGSCSFEWQMSSLWNRTELRRGKRCTDVRDPCQCCRSIDSRYDSKHSGKLCNPTQVDHSRCEPVSCVGTNDCHFTPANCTAILQLSCGG